MSTGKNRRVLVVDDNPAIHEDFKKTLRVGSSANLAELRHLEGMLFGSAPTVEVDAFELSLASQGEDALSLVVEARHAGRPFAMTFVDMRMPPGWNGTRTIREILAVDPDVQIVVCTAYADGDWNDVVAELGGSDRLLLLKKPFDAAEAFQLASALTEKWELARQAGLKLEELRTLVDEQTRDLEATNLRLRDTETRYALAAAGASDGLWDWDLKADAIFYSPRWLEMVGMSGDVGSSPRVWLERIVDDDRPRVERFLAEHLESRDAYFSVEYRIRRGDGSIRSMLCRGGVLRDETGQPCRAAGSQTDITDRKRAEEELRHAALHDTLTGLTNRAHLMQRLGGCLARVKARRSSGFAVMFVDLDRFKIVNDSLGHLVGDALLVALAARLAACVRGADTVGLSERSDLHRIGGDEFVILLEGIHEEKNAVAVAERLLSAVVTPITVEQHDIHISISVGIAMGHAGYSRVEDVLRDADTALHKAKADGRGRYRVFREDLHASVMARWQTENDLRAALERGELFLQYQPVVAMETGETIHFEALVRWRHPTRGLVPPSEFIPLAEETGLIVSLGRWVIAEACRQLSEWKARLEGVEGMAIAVNVASRQFLDPSFVDGIVTELTRAGISPSMLKLEITESAMMSPRAIETCARLEQLGLRMYLDDFGTGYSSLSYLHRISLYGLKIDRSFVSTACEDPRSASIVRAILALADALGLKTVAEGVETEGQLELLRSLGCPEGQGYFWSPALDAERAFRRLSEEHATPPLAIAC